MLIVTETKFQTFNFRVFLDILFWNPAELEIPEAKHRLTSGMDDQHALLGIPRDIKFQCHALISVLLTNHLVILRGGAKLLDAIGILLPLRIDGETRLWCPFQLHSST